MGFGMRASAGVDSVPLSDDSWPTHLGSDARAIDDRATRREVRLWVFVLLTITTVASTAAIASCAWSAAMFLIVHGREDAFAAASDRAIATVDTVGEDLIRGHVEAGGRRATFVAYVDVQEGELAPGDPVEVYVNRESRSDVHVVGQLGGYVEDPDVWKAVPFVPIGAAVATFAAVFAGVRAWMWLTASRCPWEAVVVRRGRPFSTVEGRGLVLRNDTHLPRHGVVHVAGLTRRNAIVRTRFSKRLHIAAVRPERGRAHAPVQHRQPFARHTSPPPSAVVRSLVMSLPRSLRPVDGFDERVIVVHRCAGEPVDTPCGVWLTGGTRIGSANRDRIASTRGAELVAIDDGIFVVDDHDVARQHRTFIDLGDHQWRSIRSAHPDSDPWTGFLVDVRLRPPGAVDLVADGVAVVASARTSSPRSEQETERTTVIATDPSLARPSQLVAFLAALRIIGPPDVKGESGD